MRGKLMRSCVALAAIGCAGPSLAAVVNPNPPAFDLQVTFNNVAAPQYTSAGTTLIDLDGDAGNVWKLKGDTSTSGSSGTGFTNWFMTWDLTFDPDPFINGNLSIRNLAAATRDFSVNLLLPVSPLAAPTAYRGSISTLVEDFNNSGSATFSEASSATQPGIYAGRTDGNMALSLLDLLDLLDLLATTLNCSGVGCNASTSETSLGHPSFLSPGPAVNSSIGTTLRFSLSAGDKVTFNTTFEVVPVPVPAALPLLFSALGGLIAVGARRKAA